MRSLPLARRKARQWDERVSVLFLAKLTGSQDRDRASVRHTCLVRIPAKSFLSERLVAASLEPLCGEVLIPRSTCLFSFFPPAHSG